MKGTISRLETLDDQLFGSDNEEEVLDNRKTSLNLTSSRSSPKKSDDATAALAKDGKSGNEGTEEILIVKKRKARRQVNESDIAGDEGIKRIYQEFPSLCKFRGRGYEAHDLKQMINVYKEWCFQLYPSIAYEDVIDKIFTFSSKSSVSSTLEYLRNQECNRYMVRLPFPITLPPSPFTCLLLCLTLHCRRMFLVWNHAIIPVRILLHHHPQ
jgi:hypothetical protein